MTPAQTYQTSLVVLGVSQVQAARIMGVDERTSRRWAHGEVPIPRSVLMLLGLLMSLASAGMPIDLARMERSWQERRGVQEDGA